MRGGVGLPHGRIVPGMLSKPFDKPEPPKDDYRNHAGWEAERDVAFVLQREYGDPARRDVRVFNDLRLPATFASGAVIEGDFAQIDHLVLHRSGFALVESKSVHGDMHVDQRDQWQRRSRWGTDNIDSPVTQVERQAKALLRLCQSSPTPLLDKSLGLLQAGFGHFPARVYVSIGKSGRFTGSTRPYESTVMKVDMIVRALRTEIVRHRSRAGVIGTIRGALAVDLSDAGTFNLSDVAMDRIETFLLSKHEPLRFVGTESVRPHTAPIAAPPPSTIERVERLEALACAKCTSINVQIIFARDYCLKCGECGRFTPLPYVCPHCGKHATIRKDGAVHYRECDGPGGCGKVTVFARS